MEFWCDLHSQKRICPSCYLSSHVHGIQLHRGCWRRPPAILRCVCVCVCPPGPCLQGLCVLMSQCYVCTLNRVENYRYNCDARHLFLNVCTHYKAKLVICPLLHSAITFSVFKCCWIHNVVLTTSLFVFVGQQKKGWNLITTLSGSHYKAAELQLKLIILMTMLR